MVCGHAVLARTARPGTWVYTVHHFLSFFSERCCHKQTQSSTKSTGQNTHAIIESRVSVQAPLRGTLRRKIMVTIKYIETKVMVSSFL